MESNYLYGKNSFAEALHAKRIIKAYILKDSPFLDELKKSRTPYEIVDRKTLDKMSKSGNHQGALAEVESYKLYELKDIINTSKQRGLIVMLDGITDPQNFGAIIRTCECAGVDGIIYKKHNSVKLNDTVAKVASGALENVKVVEVVNLTNTLKKLKEEGYWVVGSTGKAKDSYTDVDYNRNIVLIIGSEGDGVSRLVLEECDYKVKIDMKGRVDSLNASVATGVLLFNILVHRN